MVEGAGGVVAEPRMSFAVRVLDPESPPGVAHFVHARPADLEARLEFPARLRWRYHGRHRLPQAPRFAPRGEHRYCAQHWLAFLHDLHGPVLGGAIGTNELRLNVEGPRLDGRHEIRRQGEGVSDPLLALEERVQRRGRGDATERPDEIPVQLAGVAAKAPLAHRLEGDCAVERMRLSHRQP